jgi:hypothetical protein
MYKEKRMNGSKSSPVIVLSIATDPNNKYVSEFVQTLVELGYDYHLLGTNKKWEGFTTKMKYFIQALKDLPLNQLVIVCDSYDVLFIEPPDVIIEKYNEKAKDKIVVGLENITRFFCGFSTICDPEILTKCNIKNKMFPAFVFPNAGFLMGPAGDLLKIYQFMSDHHYKDDQYSLFQYIMQNCSKMYFDYNLDFVFNYCTPTSFFIKTPPKVTLSKSKRSLIVNGKATPACVHIPGHYLDFGKRSERIRNYLLPKRKGNPAGTYAVEFYGKICKPEFSYFGYWWWILVFIFIIVLIITRLS